MTESPRQKDKLSGFEWWKSINSPKYVTAPMVDQSELAFRMLVRGHGSDLCYTPMIHSRIFLETPKLRSSYFETCDGDWPLIAQFCGDEPETMIAAARLLDGNVQGVDVNFGCPQGIAKRGHYGSYLLSEPDLCEGIVSALCKGMTASAVSAKIRVVSPTDFANACTLQDTVNLVKRLEAVGVDMVCVHGRVKEMKGQFTGSANWDAIKSVRNALPSIPVIGNGNIWSFDDVEAMLAHTGVNAVMSSEGILARPDLFAPNPSLSNLDLAREYMSLAIKLGRVNAHAFAKPHLFKMLHHELSTVTEARELLAKARTMDEMIAVIDMLDTAYKTTSLQQVPVWANNVSWYFRHPRT